MNEGAKRSRVSRQGYTGAGLLVLAFLVLASLAAVPYLWRQSLAPQLDESRQLLALIEEKIKDAEANRKAKDVNDLNAPQAFVEGRTAGLATASLQKIMLGLATGSGLVVEKVQPLPAEAQGGVATLRLDLETSGSLDNLRSLLTAIESSAPLIFIKEIHLSVPADTGQGDNAFPAEHLTVSLQIEAYGWWGETS